MRRRRPLVVVVDRIGRVWSACTVELIKPQGCACVVPCARPSHRVTLRTPYTANSRARCDACGCIWWMRKTVSRHGTHIHAQTNQPQPPCGGAANFAAVTRLLRERYGRDREVAAPPFVASSPLAQSACSEPPTRSVSAIPWSRCGIRWPCCYWLVARARCN